MTDRPRLLVVTGPTASGKTDVAIALAQRLSGEIVNADSRQVYRRLNIGTARPTPAQRAIVPHHLLDVVEPDEAFTLADYLQRARETIDRITARHRLPILTGGTGLYVRAVTQGFDVPRVPPNPVLRSELEMLVAAHGTSALLARLRQSDPLTAETIDARNPRRLVRAIEVVEATKRSFAAQQVGAPGYDVLILGLTASRSTLYQRADSRVDAMMAAGFLGEVEALLAAGYSPDLPALSSLGYFELGEHVRGLRSLADAIQSTKWATHRLIRRQLTWFRREPGIQWIDVEGGDAEARALDLAAHWRPALAERAG